MYAAIYFAYISCAVAALLTLEKEKAINSLLEERGVICRQLMSLYFAQRTQRFIAFGK